MTVPFTKAHGTRNDFLLTWRDRVPANADLRAFARAICDRHTGPGADGWLLVSAQDGNADAAIQLFNSDGSDSEISGNGTRCAAAFLIDAGRAKPPDVRIATGAGLKTLRMIERREKEFLFEMNMGRPVCRDGDLHFFLPLEGGAREVTILDVGNPQCAVFVEDFDFDWRTMGAEIENHPHFPRRTNVSFVRSRDRHSIEVRFFERGAGETMSSGTGSTGAAAAAVLRGLAESPVRVYTAAGPLDLRWLNDEIHLTGPSAIVASGEFYS